MSKVYRCFRGIVCAAILISFICIPNGFVRADPLDDKFRELQNLQQEIEGYRSQIASQKKNETSVTAEIQKLDRELALAETELNYIVTRMGYLNGEIDDTRRAIDEVKERLAAQKTAYDARLVSMYKSRNVSYIEVLLQSENLSDFLSRVRYLRAVALHDNDIMAEYKADQAQLVSEQEALENNLAQMLSLKSEQETKRVEVASRSKDREAYLTQLQKDRKRMEQAVEALEAESKALEKIIADLQAQNPREKKENLSFIWPASGGWISDVYGNREHPVLGGTRFHSGIDYAANRGSDIKAAEDGTVILSGTNGGYGLCVVIDHGGGISTLYGHADKLLVKVGQVVAQGQVIAKVGSTGVSTGPHLHFEVRVNGATQNPLDWLP